LNLGSALLAQGKSDEAIANYRNWFAPTWQCAGPPGACQGAGEARENGGSDSATHEAVRQQPEDFDARSLSAAALIRQHRLVEAADHFATAIRLRPASSSHASTMHILASAGKTAEARAQFEEALRLKPDFAPAHLNLAVALAEQNRLDDAINHLRKCCASSLEMPPLDG